MVQIQFAFQSHYMYSHTEQNIVVLAKNITFPVPGNNFNAHMPKVLFLLNKKVNNNEPRAIALPANNSKKYIAFFFHGQYTNKPNIP